MAVDLTPETQSLIEGLIDWGRMIIAIDFGRYLFGAGGVFLVTWLGRRWLAVRKIRGK